MKDEIINLQEERKNLLKKLQLLEEKKGTVKESVFTVSYTHLTLPTKRIV